MLGDSVHEFMGPDTRFSNHKAHQEHSSVLSFVYLRALSGQ